MRIAFPLFWLDGGIHLLQDDNKEKFSDPETEKDMMRAVANQFASAGGPDEDAVRPLLSIARIESCTTKNCLQMEVEYPAIMAPGV